LLIGDAGFDATHFMSTVVLVNKVEPARRTYRMDVRAERAAATRARIVEATQSLFMERWVDEISLRDIAARAGVALQTLVRHFGTRDALLDAASLENHERSLRLRVSAPVGDIAGAVAAIVELMEEAGPRVLRGLAQEDRIPGLRASVERGRVTHRRWVEAVFDPLLPTSRAVRARRVAQLVVITDVYTWKLLRLDRGFSRKETEVTLVEITGLGES